MSLHTHEHTQIKKRKRKKKVHGQPDQRLQKQRYLISGEEMPKSPRKGATEKKKQTVTGSTQKFSPTLEYKVAKNLKGQLEGEGSTKTRKGY